MIRILLYLAIFCVHLSLTFATDKNIPLYTSNESHPLPNERSRSPTFDKNAPKTKVFFYLPASTDIQSSDDEQGDEGEQTTVHKGKGVIDISRGVKGNNDFTDSETTSGSVTTSTSHFSSDSSLDSSSDSSSGSTKSEKLGRTIGRRKYNDSDSDSDSESGSERYERRREGIRRRERRGRNGRRRRRRREESDEREKGEEKEEEDGEEGDGEEGGSSDDEQTVEHHKKKRMTPGDRKRKTRKEGHQKDKTTEEQLREEKPKWYTSHTDDELSDKTEEEMKHLISTSPASSEDEDERKGKKKIYTKHQKKRTEQTRANVKEGEEDSSDAEVIPVGKSKKEGKSRSKSEDRYEIAQRRRKKDKIRGNATLSDGNMSAVDSVFEYMENEEKRRSEMMQKKRELDKKQEMEKERQRLKTRANSNADISTDSSNDSVYFSAVDGLEEQNKTTIDKSNKTWSDSSGKGGTHQRDERENRGNQEKTTKEKEEKEKEDEGEGEDEGKNISDIDQTKRKRKKETKTEDYLYGSSDKEASYDADGQEGYRSSTITTRVGSDKNGGQERQGEKHGGGKKRKHYEANVSSDEDDLDYSKTTKIRKTGGAREGVKNIVGKKGKRRTRGIEHDAEYSSEDERSSALHETTDKTTDMRDSSGAYGKENAENIHHVKTEESENVSPIKSNAAHRWLDSDGDTRHMKKINDGQYSDTDTSDTLTSDEYVTSFKKDRGKGYDEDTDDFYGGEREKTHEGIYKVETEEIEEGKTKLERERERETQSDGEKEVTTNQSYDEATTPSKKRSRTSPFEFSNRVKARYYYSEYNKTRWKELEKNNQINLEKMIGKTFVKKMKSYCRNIKKTIQGEYFDAAVKYITHLEEIRRNYLKKWSNTQKLPVSKKNALLNILLNKKTLSSLKNEKDSQKINESSFNVDEQQQLNTEFNSILREYICHIFIENPGKNIPEKLYNFSRAMGFLLQDIRLMNNVTVPNIISLAHNMFLLSANNIYLLGHVLVLSMAHFFYDDFFISKRKGFYTFEQMVLENSDTSFFMINEMCSIYYRLPKNLIKDITFIPRNLRKNRIVNLIGEPKIHCNMLEIVMNTILLAHHYELTEVFHVSGLTNYENSVSFSINALRVFSSVCPKNNNGKLFRCKFEESTLCDKKLEELIKKEKEGVAINYDESTTGTVRNGYSLMQQMENHKKLKSSFNLLQTYMYMENHSNDTQVSSFYINLIMEQHTFANWYKYAFWYDKKQFIYTLNEKGDSKKKTKDKFVYNEYMKLSTLLKKKLIAPNLNYEIRTTPLKIYYILYDKTMNKYYNKRETKKNVKEKNKSMDELYSFRNFLYFSSPAISKIYANIDILQAQLKYIQKDTEGPMSVVMRGNLLDVVENYAKKDNLFFINLFLMNFFSNTAPIETYYKQERDFQKSTLAGKFTTSTSIFIPSKLRKIVVHLKKGGLKKKLYCALAKVKILQYLPPSVFENITSSILFTTHTIADMQFNQSALEWNLPAHTKNKEDKAFSKKIFTKGGFVGYADRLFSQWNKKGFEEFKTEEIVKFKKKLGLEKTIEYETSTDEEEAREKNMNGKMLKKQEEVSAENTDMLTETSFLLNENDNWDHYVIKQLIKAYDIWLNANSTKALQSVDFVYQLVADSKHMLESHIHDTILFARTAKPVKQTAFRNFFKRIISLGNMLLRRPTFKTQHAVWFGAVINIRQIFIVLEKLNELQRVFKNDTESWLMKEAFIELVQHVVDISTDKHLREPFGTRRNPGMMAIRPDYASLSETERKVEFQKSMCADHCVSIWLLIVNFALDHLKAPESLIKYEQTFSQHKFANSVTDKNFVNSFKLILGNDALLHFFNVLLPKKAKKDIKAMEFGASVNFAFLLKLVRLIFNQMNLPNLAQMYYMQAPYFGHFIGKWKKSREESRRREIFSFMTLGSLSFLTFLNATDITQHAQDIGMGPQETCYFREIPPAKICAVKTAAGALTNSAETAMKTVFSVGIFAAMGPALFIPMVGYSVWSILKSEFQVLQRIDMAIGNVFRNLFRKFLSSAGLKKLKSVFKRKKIIKSKIIENAQSQFEQMKNQSSQKGNIGNLAQGNVLKNVHRYTGSKVHHISYAIVTK